MTTEGTFMGFEIPRENWSKLPHSFIESLPLIQSLGEMKVILYILRHTWGFQDSEKKITIDEFMNGRKTRKGRMDDGTGLSKPTILDGLKRATEHGFINIETDDRDGGRVKKFYSLAMSDNSTGGVKKLDTAGKVSLPRTEKDTLERNLERERGSVEPLHPDGMASVEVVDAQPTVEDVSVELVDTTPTVEEIEEASVDIQQSKDNSVPNKNHLKYSLQNAFVEITNIPRPDADTPKKAKAVNALWWTPLLEIAQWCDWNEDTSTRLMRKTVQKMTGDRLTISNPKSILNVAKSLFAEHLRRKSEHDRAIARMEADPQYQAGKKMRELEEADAERTIAANKAKAEAQRERAAVFMGKVKQKSPVNSFD